MNHDPTAPPAPHRHDPMPPAARAAPHWTRRRLWAVPTLLAVNVLVFLAWQAAATGSDPWTFLARNFLVSTQRLDQGMWWTLVTAAFSHMELWHLALNMVVLWSFGSVLERLLGVRVFVTFYMVAAVVSSASHCLVSSLILGDDRISALGASGAVSGLLLAFALLFPRHRILVFAVVPVPALAGALFFVAIDLWGLVAQGRGVGLPIGHGAHLGGALCGALFYFGFLKDRFSRTPVPDSPRSRTSVDLTADEAAEFDRVRTKLSNEGPHALTPKEQEFLMRLRRRALGEEEPPD